MYRFMLALLLACLCLGCEETEVKQVPPQLVVEGWIDSGGFPIVKLTTTVPVSKQAQSTDSLDRFLVRWARVTVSDGTREVVLTGMPRRDYFPPYIYTTSEMRGEVGKTYTLKVDYQDFHAHAVTTIPKPVALSRISAEKIPLYPEWFKLRIDFKDDPATTDYYKVFIRLYGENQDFHSTNFGTYNDRLLPIQASLLVENARQNAVNPTATFFKRYEAVNIKFCHIDSVSYAFWKSFDDYQSEGRNPLFNSMQNIRSNIQGGLGYWCGYGVSYYLYQILN